MKINVKTEPLTEELRYLTKSFSLYKRNYFEDLEEGLHFSFKDDEKGCRPMYLALDAE